MVHAYRNIRTILIKLAPFLIIIALLAVLPFFLSNYWIRIVVNIFLFATMAAAANVITGMAGYAALGNAVFFGIGAYSTTLFMNMVKVPFVLALVLGGVICIAVAFVFGVGILRTKGHYFVMATIAFNEVVREVVRNVEFTGGGRGLSLPLPPWGIAKTYLIFYYLTLLCMVICVCLVRIIFKSKLGIGLQAIRMHEDAAGVMGINVPLFKTIAWSFSAFFTGLCGGIFAFWYGFIEPQVVFDLMVSVKFYIMLILGGVGTFIGPLIGAVSLEILDSVVWSKFPEYHFAVLGVLVLIITLLIPRGIAFYAEQFLRQLKRGRLKNDSIKG